MNPCRDDATFTCVDTYDKRGKIILSQSRQRNPSLYDSVMGFTLFYPSYESADAGRGLQPRPKRLVASIMFETLNVKDGVANPVPLWKRGGPN